jgi:uncharacterized membrane protein
MAAAPAGEARPLRDGFIAEWVLDSRAMTLLLALHALAAVLWVGGMFFAYLVLRPAAGALEREARLNLWGGVFGRFFPWVWASVGLLLATGYAMFLHFGVRGMHVHLMQATGILMMLLFAHLFFVPWRRFGRALAASDLGAAGAELDRIRRIVAINLVLGLATIAIGSSGRYWG